MKDSSNSKKSILSLDRVLLFVHSSLIEIRENALFGTWGMVVTFGVMAISRLLTKMRFGKSSK